MDYTMNEIAEENDNGVPKSRRDAFLLSLLKKRKEAISGRLASGIESEWQEDDEHYNGIDDANRAFVSSTYAHAKRWATGFGSGEKAPTRSVIFLNITRPYVDAASARVADMLLPTDDRAWALKPTPIPRLPQSLVDALGGQEQAQAIIEANVEQAKVACKAMQDEIDDCLTESNWHGEVRHLIEDSARIGSGVLKGPYPCKRTAKMLRKQDGFSEYIQITEIKPGSKRIDPWNLFPDPSCGESIHYGSYVWEREYVSARQVRDLIDMPGYDRAEVMAAMKEGPSKAQSGIAQAGMPTNRGDEQFELWIFHGTVDADDLAEYGVETEDETPKAQAMAVMINDRLIKVALTPVDTDGFPYDVLAWQRRPGLPWGTGVSRQMRTVQRMINGACRAMMDNSGLTASPQIILGNGVVPADGQWTIRGGKIWRAEPDVTDVRAAFHAFVPPSVQQEMMNIIVFAQKMAEDVTGMPAMLQGIRGDAPETLGGMQMQNNNATSVLRRLAKRFDDYMTRPHIQRYFDWMMQHSEREEIKGDFQIDVRASSALVERDAQQQFLMTLLQASANPIYGLDPVKLAGELLKGQRLDPKTIQYSPEKLAQLTQPQSSPVDEAKVSLIQAQTRKTDAEATNKAVESQFSATQAAQNIAIQPAVAPLADALLKSAGYQDQDLPPIVPEVPQGLDVMPPERNTNPLTPANPAVGMEAGIEGGDDESQQEGMPQ